MLLLAHLVKYNKQLQGALKQKPKSTNDIKESSFSKERKGKYILFAGRLKNTCECRIGIQIISIWLIPVVCIK